MQQTLEQMRREYTQGGLRRTDLAADPLVQFNRWFEQAVQAGITDPTAMTLATVSAAGQPSQRIVLLKHLDERGLVFYTNTASRKGVELAQNPRASAHFPWHSLDRQVKICGQVEALPAARAQAYFCSRPQASQLAAWASEQSHVISSRAALMDNYEKLCERFASGDIPVPDTWGGYCLVPHEIEFWQGGAHRLHDCFRYLWQGGGQWQIDRLGP